MSTFFQLITLLLIENIYFAGTRVKDPYTLAQISPSTNRSDLYVVGPNFKSIRPLGSTSKIQFQWTSWKNLPKFQFLDLWKARPNFKFIGPLESTSKIQILGPLGSTSKIQDRWSSKKHDWNPHFVVTIGKHVLCSFFSIKKKKKSCMHELRLDLILSPKGT